MNSLKSFEMLVKMRPNDYLPIPFVATMLGTDEGEIRRQVRVNGLKTLPLSKRDPQRPRQKGVNFVDSDTPYYLFRDGIRELVRLIKTKESDAIFDHLLDRGLFRSNRYLTLKLEGNPEVTT